MALIVNLSDSESRVWLTSTRGGQQLLVCLHASLSSLQVHPATKHLTCVSWLVMQETDGDTSRQEMFCTCRSSRVSCTLASWIFHSFFFAEDNIVQAVHSMQIEVEEILCD